MQPLVQIFVIALVFIFQSTVHKLEIRLVEILEWIYKIWKKTYTCVITSCIEII